MKKRFGESSQSADDRTKGAAFICLHLDKYKLCLGCESVLHREANICPLCHSYRFEMNSETVKQAALRLARKKSDQLTT